MVRIYHLNDDKQSYTYSDHEATVFRRRSIFAQGAGFVGASEFSVRIFTDDNITVSEGDYIALEGSIEDEPDGSVCSVITEVTDNRRGTRPHWRLVCGGDQHG